MFEEVLSKTHHLTCRFESQNTTGIFPGRTEDIRVIHAADSQSHVVYAIKQIICASPELFLQPLVLDSGDGIVGPVFDECYCYDLIEGQNSMNLEMNESTRLAFR